MHALDPANVSLSAYFRASSPPEEVIRRHDDALHSGAAPGSLAESADSPAFPGTTPKRMPPPWHPEHFFNGLLDLK